MATPPAKPFRTFHNPVDPADLEAWFRVYFAHKEICDCGALCKDIRETGHYHRTVYYRCPDGSISVFDE